MLFLHPDFPDDKERIEWALGKKLGSVEDFIGVACTLMAAFHSFAASYSERTQKFSFGGLKGKPIEGCCLFMLEHIELLATEARVLHEKHNEDALILARRAFCKQAVAGIPCMLAAVNAIYRSCDEDNFWLKNMYLSLSVILLGVAFSLSYQSYRDEIKHQSDRFKAEVRYKKVHPYIESHLYMLRLREAISWAREKGVVPVDPLPEQPESRGLAQQLSRLTIVGR